MLMLAVNPTVVPVQEVCVIVIAGATAGLMAMAMLLDDAVVGFAQDKLDVITQLTTCPLVKVVVVYVELLVPAFIPFTFH